MPRMIRAAFHLRMPDEIEVWIEREAERNCRSKNQEIVFRLKEAMAAVQASRPSASDGATAAGQASQA